MDGATEWQVFRHVSLPQLLPTLGVVMTTMIINCLKIFDIVYVMTNGNYGTEVIANRMYKECSSFASTAGRALAVVLFLAILPFIILSVRCHPRESEYQWISVSELRPRLRPPCARLDLPGVDLADARLLVSSSGRRTSCRTPLVDGVPP